jgi:shikimate kinase
LSRSERCVIATGGGIVLRPENRRLLRESGTVIWLTADAETVWRRLEQDTTTAQRRPVLTVGGLAEVRDLLAVREPLYRECAHWSVDTANQAPEDLAQMIWQWFVRPSSGQRGA